MNRALRTADLVARLTTLDLDGWTAPIAAGPAEVAAVLESPTHEGLVCLLGASIDRSLVVVDESSATSVRDAWAELMARSVQLDLLLLQVCTRLADAGISSRVLKGVAVATLDERDPAWRSYNDVDVLVPTERLLAAADALAPLGLRPATPPISRRWAGRYAKGLTLVHRSGAQVDLHRLLATGPLGSRVRSECLFERGRPLRVGADTLTALADEHRFLHACYHAALGGVRGVRHRRDILLLAHAVAPSVAMGQVVDGWSPAVVHSAVQWAGEAGGLPAEWVQWLAEVECDAADRTLLAQRAATFGERSLVELRSMHGTVERLRFGAPLVWPSRAHLRGRHLGRAQYLRRLIRVRRSPASPPAVTTFEHAIGPHTVPTPSPQVHAEFLDDQAVLYDVVRARPVLLNVTASAVWAALDGESSVAQVAADLAARFGADPDTVLEHVTAAVCSFDELGLLTSAPPSVIV